MVVYILSRPDVVNLIPPDFEFVWSAIPFTAQDGNQYYNLLAVIKDPEISGKVITVARATIDPDNNAPIVIMRMNSEGERFRSPDKFKIRWNQIYDIWTR